MKKQKRVLRRMTAVAAAVALAAAFTFPADMDCGNLTFGNSITVRAEPVSLDINSKIIVITETGYSVNGGDETAYTGDYVITGYNVYNTKFFKDLIL